MCAGIKHVSVADDTVVAPEDVGAHLFLREEHVGKSTRADATLPGLRELNAIDNTGIVVVKEDGLLTEDGYSPRHTAPSTLCAQSAWTLRWGEHRRLKYASHTTPQHTPAAQVRCLRPLSIPIRLPTLPLLPPPCPASDFPMTSSRPRQIEGLSGSDSHGGEPRSRCEDQRALPQAQHRLLLRAGLGRPAESWFVAVRIFPIQGASVRSGMLHTVSTVQRLASIPCDLQSLADASSLSIRRRP